MHNAGHTVFGPAEAFTQEQLAELYDINVLGGKQQEVFRQYLDLVSTANGIMAFLKSLGGQVRLAGGQPDDLVSQMADLARRWVTST
jgi:hypothetical protein